MFRRFFIATILIFSVPFLYLLFTYSLRYFVPKPQLRTETSFSSHLTCCKLHEVSVGGDVPSCYQLTIQSLINTDWPTAPGLKEKLNEVVTKCAATPENKNCLRETAFAIFPINSKKTHDECWISGTDDAKSRKERGFLGNILHEIERRGLGKKE